MDFFKLTQSQKAIFKNKIKYFVTQQLNRHFDYFISVILREQKALNKNIEINDEYINNLTKALYEEFSTIAKKASKELTFNPQTSQEVNYKTVVTKNDDTQLARKFRILLKQ